MAYVSAKCIHNENSQSDTDNKIYKSWHLQVETHLLQLQDKYWQVLKSLVAFDPNAIIVLGKR